MDEIRRIKFDRKRSYQAEDVKTILQGIDKVLDIYSNITKVMMKPPTIIEHDIDKPMN